jgi:hypothetical protein
MHTPFKTRKDLKTRSGRRDCQLKRIDRSRSSLAVAILVALGAWLGGSGVLASAGKGVFHLGEAGQDIYARAVGRSGGKSLVRVTGLTETQKRTVVIRDTQSSDAINKVAGVNAVRAGGGPVVLDGMDPVFHANCGSSTDGYIKKVLKSVYDKSDGRPSNNKIAILGISGPQ